MKNKIFCLFISVLACTQAVAFIEDAYADQDKQKVSTVAYSDQDRRDDARRQSIREDQQRQTNTRQSTREEQLRQDNAREDDLREQQRQQDAQAAQSGK